MTNAEYNQKNLETGDLIVAETNKGFLIEGVITAITDTSITVQDYPDGDLDEKNPEPEVLTFLELSSITKCW